MTDYAVIDVNTVQDWADSADVVVVGFGAAGSSAARARCPIATS